MSQLRIAAFLAGALAVVPRPAAAQPADPALCSALTSSFEKDGFLAWHRALDPCWRTGLTSWPAIFKCGYDNLPASMKYDCVRGFLWQAPITQTTIADIIEFNSDQNCPGVINQYKSTGYAVWTNAIRACQPASGSCLHDDIFECAWNQLPGADQKPCLRAHLSSKDVPQTEAVIGEVRGRCAIRDSVAANQSTHDFTMVGSEMCELPTDDAVSDDYYAAQAHESVFDHDGSNLPIDRRRGRNLGDNEGRLRADLRTVARVADPRSCSLPLAAHAFAEAAITSDPGLKEKLLVSARAYADLSVTGRRAFDAFRQDPPGVPYCVSIGNLTMLAAGCDVPLTPMDPSKVVGGCSQALDRAYDVANFLRTGQAVTTAGPWYDAFGTRTPAADKDHQRKLRARRALGWIAVSGEDDLPHRPVNVPSSDSPQFDIDVMVDAPLQLLGLEVNYPPMQVPVHARYVIAQSRSAGLDATAPAHWTLKPDYTPALEANSEVLLFIHGMDSRAEEAEDITRHLFARMGYIESGKNLVVVTVDLPSSGYTDVIDYNAISPIVAIGYPNDANTDFWATGKTPVLDFLEEFVVAFAARLDEPDKLNRALLPNVKAVMGGSLGGNLSFRLGRRPNTPWLPNVIAWSPASVWLSMGEGNDPLKHSGPREAWWRASDRDTKDPNDLTLDRLGRRKDFFVAAWDFPASPVTFYSQPMTWYSPYYQCRRAAINHARLDRHETYTAAFRTWHWRLGAEQLLYSHHTIDAAAGMPRYMLNDKRMLLACGADDQVPYNHICPSTIDTANAMTFTPGEAMYLKQTGHALDNERPRYWALQIETFLGLR